MSYHHDDDGPTNAPASSAEAITDNPAGDTEQQVFANPPPNTPELTPVMDTSAEAFSTAIQFRQDGLVQSMLNSLSPNALATHASGPTIIADLIVAKCIALIPQCIRLGAHVLRVHKNGMSALHMACVCESCEAVLCLLAAGVAVNPLDHSGKTPLDYVINLMDPAVAEMQNILMQHGARRSVVPPAWGSGGGNWRRITSSTK
jgi:hypothetical protein